MGVVQIHLQKVIWLVAMVVFVGTLMLWIMLPTQTYSQNWSPKIKTKVTHTAYLGSQGYNILIFTSPVLLIATLGSLFLHLGRTNQPNENNSNPTSSEEGKKWWWLTKLRRPILVKASPLGIVSLIEISFLLMFLALLVWSLSTYIHNWFASITPQYTAMLEVKAWQAKLEDSAVILGVVGNICLAFLFFPVTRGSTVLPLFGLTSESSIKYHIWLGHIVLTLFTAHGLCYIIFWAVTNDISKMVEWKYVGASNVAGEISLLAGLIMWATTFPKIRRKFFELFFYTHHLYIVFMVFFVLHVGISYSFMMLPGLYLFLVDRFVRFLQSRNKVRLVSARVLSCGSVELNFAKNPNLSYNPTSIMFVNVPAISKLSWHPFTVTSSNGLEPEKLSIVVKSHGGWSNKLFQMISSPSAIDRLEVSVEGPYGPASKKIFSHETLIMVSGGSGITPMISIIRELIYASSVLKIKTPKTILVCAFKNSADLTMLDLLLPISGSEQDISNLELQIEAYVTKEIQRTTEENSINPRVISFKPKPSDSPISPILGPNSWLWLGAIIASSFIIFLIIIGLITNYYIYPKDHNTSMIFSWSIQGTLYMLFICVSIVVTSSAAMIWNRKQIDKQKIHIQNSTLSSSQASPLPGNHNIELESFPQQSLIQGTNIHYGRRPDLKNIILGCEGSSIGVLVSGPRTLRHEVASICSIGLEKNLHFESISFSW
ncbi:hypothetical protein ACFE04_026274 [Oxalis oulophora]